MYIWLKRGETVSFKFSLANGTCYLTSHRLIAVEHEKGHLEEGICRDYAMKDFLVASLTNQAVIAHFTGHRQVKLETLHNAACSLQEVKQYIEQAAALSQKN